MLLTCSTNQQLLVLEVAFRSSEKQRSFVLEISDLESESFFLFPFPFVDIWQLYLPSDYIKSTKT